MLLTNSPLKHLLLVLLTRVILTNAVQQNITVDDAAVVGVVPQYLPSPAQWVQGATCPGCGAHPDPLQAYNGTWHDATFHPSDGSPRAIEVTFIGSAIYVFFILANTIQYVDTVTNMNFIIDEESVGSFVHDPSASTDFQYNVPIYVNESLPFGRHHMSMEAGGNSPAVILFDYLIYTTDVDDSLPAPSLTHLPSETPSPTLLLPETSSPTPLLPETPSPTPLLSETPSPTSLPSETPSPISSSFSSSDISPHKTNATPTVGGVVGGVVAVLLFTGAFIFCWKRKKRDRWMAEPDGIIIRARNINAASYSGCGHVPNEQPYGSLTTPYYNPRLSIHNRPSKKELAEDAQNLEAAPAFSSPEQSESLPSGSRQIAPPHTTQPSASDTIILREQVERLMDEVIRLRAIHLRDRFNDFEIVSEAPPGYSEGRRSPDDPR